MNFFGTSKPNEVTTSFGQGVTVCKTTIEGIVTADLINKEIEKQRERGFELQAISQTNNNEVFLLWRRS